MRSVKPSIKERIKAIARYKRTKIILISGLVLVLIIAAVFGTGAVRCISSKNNTPSSAVSDTSGISGNSSVTARSSFTTTATSAVTDTTATAAINITVPPPGKYKINPKITAPFQSIAAELLANCRFPVLLPTYLPQPTEEAWVISPEIKNDSFSADIKQGSSNCMADFYGTLYENIGDPPSGYSNSNEQDFINKGISPKTVHLPDGITGKEYVQASDMHGGTAIIWKSGNWSFFVEADYDDNPDFSAIHYAEQILQEIKDNGQSLPGSQGIFTLIHTGNPVLTEIYWKTNKGIWYQLDWNKDQIDAVKVAHSMVNAESK